MDQSQPLSRTVARLGAAVCVLTLISCGAPPSVEERRSAAISGQWSFEPSLSHLPLRSSDLRVAGRETDQEASKLRSLAREDAGDVVEKRPPLMRMRRDDEDDAERQRRRRSRNLLRLFGEEITIVVKGSEIEVRSPSRRDLVLSTAGSAAEDRAILEARWEEGTLVVGGSEESRTVRFEVSPDGEQLALVMSVVRQGDEERDFRRVYRRVS